MSQARWACSKTSTADSSSLCRRGTASQVLIGSKDLSLTQNLVHLALASNKNSKGKGQGLWCSSLNLISIILDLKKDQAGSKVHLRLEQHLTHEILFYFKKLLLTAIQDFVSSG